MSAAHHRSGRSLRLAFALGLAMSSPASPAAPAAPVPVALDNDAVQTAREQLRTIRYDPRFHRWQRRVPATRNGANAHGNDATSAGPSPLDRVSRTLKDFFRWLIGPSAPNPGTPPAGQSGAGGAPGVSPPWEAMLRFMGWTVLAVVAASIIYAMWARRHLHRRSAAAPVTREQLNTALQQGDALAADAPAWNRHARALVGEGDLRLAYRAAYLALLSGLHHAGRIHYRKQRTNFTYVAGYRGPDAQRIRFAGLTDAFNDCWYGHRAPNAQRFATLERDTGELLREAGQQSQEAPA